jgi:hypothetical protein
LKKERLVELANKVQDLDLAITEDADEQTQRDSFFLLTFATGDDNKPSKPVQLAKDPVYASDLRQVPQFSVADVFAYCLNECGWTTSRLKLYKNDDGHRLYRCSHIEQVQLCKVILVNFKILIRLLVLRERGSVCHCVYVMCGPVK